jgi:3-oxoacyl-[acyl-carrier protein] reductase
MLLEGKTALVTGASRGIGREIARAFARAGAAVACVATNRDLLDALAAELSAAGGRALAIAADVGRAAEAERAVEKTLEVFGRLDVLVNNAGIARDNLVMRMKDEEWDRVIEVNLRGPFFLIRAAARPMLRQRSGRIINVSSVSGLQGNVGQANYAASKAGLIGLTKSVAREFAPRGVTVNAIAPGWIATDMTERLPEEVRRKAVEAVPLGRVGTPADIAAAAVFLASDGAGYITGQTLVVDGGLSM